MKKKVSVCLIIILLSLMVAGCWNSREINTLSVVEAIGIDRLADGQISLTFQILKPSEAKSAAPGGGGPGGGKAVWVLTSTGQTIFDAVRNATFESDRKLFLPFNKIIVFGEEAARAGIASLLDFFDRDPETRLLSYVFISRGKAKDIIEAEHPQENIPAKAIESLAQGSRATSKIAQTDLISLIRTLANRSSDPYIPGINIVQEGEEGETKKIIRLGETAIFREDKLVGWFNQKETRGLLWVLGEVKSGIIVVPSPLDETEKVSLEIIRASSQVKSRMVNGKPVITVQVKEEGNLGDQKSKVNLIKPDIFSELEKRQAGVIADEINAALVKAQKEWGVDIFKFGEAVHRESPGDWKRMKENWREELTQVEVKVVVEANLRNLGLSMTPIEDPR